MILKTIYVLQVEHYKICYFIGDMLFCLHTNYVVSDVQQNSCLRIIFYNMYVCIYLCVYMYVCVCVYINSCHSIYTKGALVTTRYDPKEESIPIYKYRPTYVTTGTLHYSKSPLVSAPCWGDRFFCLIVSRSLRIHINSYINKLIKFMVYAQWNQNKKTIREN